MGRGGKIDSDRRHNYFLIRHVTWGNEGHRHVTLAFLKIDMRHRDPTFRAPYVTLLLRGSCRRQCSLYFTFSCLVSNEIDKKS